MSSVFERLDEYRRPGFYEEYDYHWAMTIDLDRCTGCQACVVACQSENNLPIVGEERCAERREIRWIRLQRYWQGEYPNVSLDFLPMLCQQCDNAPCEPVCPVFATYHNTDGVNVQVYNRCIGTQSCSVYCPYEVRFFNWFTYTWDSPLEQQLNPEVTVREKGVMEKCTFCIQRIRQARHHARDLGRRVHDGEMTPACVQACPTEAMVFGDLQDPDSQVSALAKSPRAYRVLEQLHTAPSVVYLRKGHGQHD